MAQLAQLSAQVEALRDASFFDADSIQLLEAFLNAGGYSARANRGLLRLYQLFPHLAKAEFVDAILVRGLMALPEPDFVHALTLIPESLATPVTPVLTELEGMLQKAQFAEFWARAASPAVAPLTAKVPGFGEAVRAFVAGVLGRTYRKISVHVLAQSLGLPEAAAAEWAAKKGWAAGEGGLLELPALPENTPRPVHKPGQEGLGLKYPDVAQVLAALPRM